MVGGTRILLRVHPGSRREEVVHDPVRGGFVVRVRSRAEEGEANRALLRALSRWLGVPMSSVRLVRGTRGRQKLVEVAGRDAREIEALLTRAASAPVAGARPSSEA
jgi:uncharacterized protein (TIGR00251 family)